MTEITCPNCDGPDFEIKNYTQLNLLDGQVVANESTQKTSYQCAECNFLIQTSDDLNIVEVTVHITGNSHSKMRQGINKVLRGVRGGARTDLKNVPLEVRKQGYAQIDEATWIFTANGWAEHQRNPRFALNLDNHTVKEVQHV